MDYKKDCEERLRRYAKADETLEILNKRLNKLSMYGKPNELGAIDFSKVGHSSGSKEAFDTLMEAQHIIKQIHTIEDDKEIVAEVLNKVKSSSNEDYSFLNLKYIKNIPMSIVAEKLGYSDKSGKTIYKIKDRALKNFSLYF